MYGEKLPYLSSGQADVYTYLHASENWSTALRGPAVCVCVRAYTVMSPVGNSTLKKS